MSFQSCLAHSTDLGESLFFFKIYFFIEVRLLCNIELISAVQQSDSVIHAHTFLILFHCGLSRILVLEFHKTSLYSFDKSTSPMPPFKLP